MTGKEKRRVRRKMAFRKERKTRRIMVDKGFPRDTEIPTRSFLKWIGPRRKKYLKKVSNKRVRRAENLGHGSSYKKHYDLDWILW